MVDDGLEPLVSRLAARPAVQSIVLVGSGGGRAAPDRWSDVDVWVCADEAIPDEWRSALADELADHSERVSIGKHQFGDYDDWVLSATGQRVDLMYWALDWFPEQLDKVLVRHQPSVGHSTAWWRGVAHGVVLFDRGGWWEALRARAQAPYPEPLRAGIVRWNHEIPRTSAFSFRHQIEVALLRGDAVAVNHRVAALLSSCFDVVFALNRVLHPGEKRLLDFVRRECAVVPEGFDASVARVLQSTAGGAELLAAVDELLDGIDAVVLPEFPE